MCVCVCVCVCVCFTPGRIDKTGPAAMPPRPPALNTLPQLTPPIYAYRMRQHTSASAYVSICQHTSAYEKERERASERASERAREKLQILTTLPQLPPPPSDSIYYVCIYVYMYYINTQHTATGSPACNICMRATEGERERERARERESERKRERE